MGMMTVVRGTAANKMRQKLRTGSGFTIVETMIVLAVTGGLFVAIAGTLSGRQSAAEFNHGIQNIQAHIQQTIDQVGTGFYPNNSNFSCANLSGRVSLSSGSNSQGTNDQCVFLGKVMQFGVHGTSPEQYEVYPIAGLRCQTCTIGTTSPFQNVNPTVISFSAASGTLQYGLKVVWMRSDKNIGCLMLSCSIGSVAFLMEPGSSSGASISGFSSGRQQIDLIPIPATSLGQTVPNAITSIQTSPPTGVGLNDPRLTGNAPINPTNGVQICFVGGTNNSGLITIGGTGRQLLVKLDIKGTKDCT